MTVPSHELRSRRVLAAFTVGATLLLAPGGAAAQQRTCRAAVGERVATRSVQAAVFLGHGATALVGCSTRTGKRRLIAAVAEGGDGLNRIDDVRLRGTVVVYAEIMADRYQASATLYA